MNTLKQIAAGYNRISLIGRIAAGIVIPFLSIFSSCF